MLLQKTGLLLFQFISSVQGIPGYKTLTGTTPALKKKKGTNKKNWIKVQGPGVVF